MALKASSPEYRGQILNDFGRRGIKYDLIHALTDPWEDQQARSRGVRVLNALWHSWDVKSIEDLLRLYTKWRTESMARHQLLITKNLGLTTVQHLLERIPFPCPNLDKQAAPTHGAPDA